MDLEGIDCKRKDSPGGMGLLRSRVLTSVVHLQVSIHIDGSDIVEGYTRRQ